VQTIGLVLKRDHERARAIAADLIPWLAARGLEVRIGTVHTGLAAEARIVPEEDLAEGLDLLLCLGGDGTLLHAAGLVGHRTVPVLGVNLGRLGFLVPFAPAEAKYAIERALAGKLATERRMRLDVRLSRASGDVVDRLCLNDAVISQGSMARLIELLARLDGDRVTIYKSDGLIICSPTGSTAYNLAAGGPILAPSQAAMAITPICPHTLTNRPLVVPASSRIEVELAGESRSVILTLDGQWAYPLAPGDRVEITEAKAPLVLYRSEKPYFEILREKLRWGERES
jgi:NAD+ kinase